MDDGIIQFASGEESYGKIMNVIDYHAGGIQTFFRPHLLVAFTHRRVQRVLRCSTSFYEYPKYLPWPDRPNASLPPALLAIGHMNCTHSEVNQLPRPTLSPPIPKQSEHPTGLPSLSRTP